MYDRDYIFLNRKMLDWGWYKNLNTKAVFIHCLLKANWKEGFFEGEKIPRGSFVTSINQLAEETGLSVAKIRTAIKNLKLTGELTCKGCSKFTVITVKKYDLYQKNDMIDNKQIASKQQTNDKQIATIEEGKKGKREEYKRAMHSVPPTLNEVKGYFKEKGITHVDAEYFHSFYSNLKNPWTTEGGADVTRDWKNRAKRWEKENTKNSQHENAKSNAEKPLKTRFHNFEQHSYPSGYLEQFYEKLENK